MKTIRASQTLKVPDNVDLSIRSRCVKVTGPRGTLERKFRHVNMVLEYHKSTRTVKVEMWFGNKKQLATIRTVVSHIHNMIVGVTQGYRYKMRFVYAHFPINANIPDDGKFIEIRNFLGEKIVRTLVMKEGVKISRSTEVKDEIILEGNDVEKVAESASDIHGSTLVKNKDIRKFLDGIYVSEKGPIPVEE